MAPEIFEHGVGVSVNKGIDFKIPFLNVCKKKVECTVKALRNVLKNINSGKCSGVQGSPPPKIVLPSVC